MKIMAGRQSLYWGKGTKRLVDKAISLGFRFEIQGGNIIMVFEGNYPPYEKTAYPVKHAIKNNKSAVLEYLKYLGYQEKGVKN